jgi:hypothetical protein
VEGEHPRIAPGARLDVPLTPAESSEEARGGEVIEIQDGEANEEAEPLRMAPDPGQPTETEVEEHRVTHHPYRSWCKECVEGKALGEQRGRRGGGRERINRFPIVALDYFFIVDGELYQRKELAGYSEDEVGETKLKEDREAGRVVKCIALKCSMTKVILTHVVPCKGTDEDGHISKLICEDLKWLGHVKLILKCDREPALKALVTQVIESIKVNWEDLEKVNLEHPQEYDSQSNGMIENAIKQIRAQYRTMRTCLQRRVSRHIPADHAVSAWLLEHCCTVMNAVVRGDDGATGWARARGRPFGQRLVGFGEQVFAKLPIKGPQHGADGNMAPRHVIGTFVGYAKDSNSYRIVVNNKVMNTRSIMRRPMSERWQIDAIEGITSTPWDLLGKSEVRAKFKPNEEELEKFPDRQPGVPRRFKITKKDLEEVGYSEGCPQCDHIMRYGNNQPGLQHQERCRARVLAELAKILRGQQRLQANEDRIDQGLARLVEEAVTRDDGGLHDGGRRIRGGDPGPAGPSNAEQRSDPQSYEHDPFGSADDVPSAAQNSPLHYQEDDVFQSASTASHNGAGASPASISA